jgi:hypothetical protein
MTVIKEVADAVGMLAEGVSRIRTLVDALNDGRAYLRAKHPTAEPDLAELLEQMNITIIGLVSAAETITSIDFTLDGSDRDRSPAMFNERLRDASAERAKLAANISKLKGSCSRMEKLSKDLDARAKGKPWWSLLGGRAAKQAEQLANNFGDLFFWDQRMIEQARIVLHASRRTLDEVREVLRAGQGVSGMSVANVDAAARVLWAQQAALRPHVERLEELRDEVADLIADLRPGQ